MEILQATASHIEALIQLRLDFYADLGHKANHMEDTLRSYYAEALADGSFAAWFIEEGGRPVSTVFGVFHKTIPGRQAPSGKQCTVFNVFTYPQCRGKGYAKALMGHLVGYARENGIELLDLFATEAGTYVYRPLGFTEDDNVYLSMLPQAQEATL